MGDPICIVASRWLASMPDFASFSSLNSFRTFLALGSVLSGHFVGCDCRAHGVVRLCCWVSEVVGWEENIRKVRKMGGIIVWFQSIC